MASLTRRRMWSLAWDKWSLFTCYLFKKTVIYKQCCCPDKAYEYQHGKALLL
jgi:hypothetical protein